MISIHRKHFSTLLLGKKKKKKKKKIRNLKNINRFCPCFSCKTPNSEERGDETTESRRFRLGVGNKYRPRLRKIKIKIKINLAEPDGQPLPNYKSETEKKSLLVKCPFLSETKLPNNPSVTKKIFKNSDKSVIKVLIISMKLFCSVGNKVKKRRRKKKHKGSQATSNRGRRNPMNIYVERKRLRKNKSHSNYNNNNTPNINTKKASSWKIEIYLNLALFAASGSRFAVEKMIRNSSRVNSKSKHEIK